MAVAVMITLLFLTPLFYYTPLVVLSSIIISAMLGLIDYQAAIHLWHVDKFDCVVCLSAYFGVVFGNIEIGLVIAVALSMLRVLLFMARPKTSLLGSLPDSKCYRSVDQYPSAQSIPGLLILEITAPIYFTNAGYLRERIARWIDEEEDKLKSSGEGRLQYLILNLGGMEHFVSVRTLDVSSSPQIGMLLLTLQMLRNGQSKVWRSVGAGPLCKENSRLPMDDDMWSSYTAGALKEQKWERRRRTKAASADQTANATPATASDRRTVQRLIN